MDSINTQTLIDREYQMFDSTLSQSKQNVNLILKM